MFTKDGKIVYEIRPCCYCHGTRVVNEWVICKRCNGTGKADPSKPRGRNCPVCGKGAHDSFIRGRVLSIGTAKCTQCTDGTQPEDANDFIPDSIWHAIPVKVYRSGRHQTIGENLLGMGICSTTDYGRSKDWTDEQFIAAVHDKHMKPSAIQVTLPDRVTLVDHIGVFTNNSGYSIIPVPYATPVLPQVIEQDLKLGLTHAEGMAYGMRIAALGGDGTTAATLARKLKGVHAATEPCGCTDECSD